MLAAALEDSGAVVRLAPVQEGSKLSGQDGRSLVVAVGAEGDLLASTAATRTPAASPQGEVLGLNLPPASACMLATVLPASATALPAAATVALRLKSFLSRAGTLASAGDLDSGEVLRTSTQVLMDLLSAGPVLGADAAARRSQQAHGGGVNRFGNQGQGEDTRASLGVRDLTAMLRSTSGAISAATTTTMAAAQGSGSRAQAAGVAPGVLRGEGSSSSGGCSSSTAAGLERSTAPEPVRLGEAERAAASEEAVRQLELWMRHCRPSFVDDAPAPGQADSPAWGPACDEDGTAVSLPALEYA